MFFDTHAHYDDEKFDLDRDAVLSSMPEAGIGRIVNPGCTVASSQAAIALAEQYDFVYAAVGIHPENCDGVTDADFDAIRTLASHPKVVAIGEIGLDYYWPENPPRDFQQMVFRRQMALAEECNLPVIIHDREAHGDTLAIVREFPHVHGVFHCYSGSVEEAKVLVKLGWMLSFNGAATFKNARKAPEVIRAIPLEKLMIETDSPYLAPVPHRGKRNDSRYVPLVAEKIAEYKGIDPAEVERVTTENGLRFFGI
jgi:TatD DNase family protein